MVGGDNTTFTQFRNFKIVRKFNSIQVISLILNCADDILQVGIKSKIENEFFWVELYFWCNAQEANVRREISCPNAEVSYLKQ